MTAITLTKEHKSKLLEMCKELFPEWKSHSLITNEQYISDDTGNFSESDETFKIHWFEFCVNHLSKKVFTIENKIMAGYEYFINNIRYTKQHPVDYLYKEFKKH